MQSGRGGGLTETFSGVESIFGTKTNTFLTRGTAVLAVIFLLTSLSLTYLSKKKGESLLQNETSSKSPSKTTAAPLVETKTVPEPLKQSPETPKTAQETTTSTLPTTTVVNETAAPTQPTPQNIENTEQATKQE